MEPKIKLENLFSDIEEASEELKQEELTNKSGTSFVSKNGIYKSTIERAYITATKKGGVQFDLHLSGDNSINFRTYPVSVDKKTGKKVTTYTYQGKTFSLQDYKMMKQVVFCATGKGQELNEIKIETQTVTFKEYGKEVTLEVGMLVDLIGKEIQYGVRCEEEFNYEDGALDKTEIKTDNEGNPRYKKILFSVYTGLGKTAIELIKKTDPIQLEKDKEFLLGSKGIKRVKLEAKEIEDVTIDVDEDEEIPF